ncbi:MAG: hypothetical protein ACAI44_19525, partial [Candidatus Sericytochromatia bacterium]
MSIMRVRVSRLCGIRRAGLKTGTGRRHGNKAFQTLKKVQGWQNRHRGSRNLNRQKLLAQRLLKSLRKISHLNRHFGRRL